MKYYYVGLIKCEPLNFIVNRPLLFESKAIQICTCADRVHVINCKYYSGHALPTKITKHNYVPALYPNKHNIHVSSLNSIVVELHFQIRCAKVLTVVH